MIYTLLNFLTGFILIVAIIGMLYLEVIDARDRREDEKLLRHRWEPTWWPRDPPT